MCGRAAGAIDESVRRRWIGRGGKVLIDAIGESHTGNAQAKAIVAVHIHGPGADGNGDIGGRSSGIKAASNRIDIGSSVGQQPITGEPSATPEIHILIVAADIGGDGVASRHAIEHVSGVGDGVHRTGGGIDHAHGPLSGWRGQGIGFVADTSGSLTPTGVVEGIGCPGRS